MNEEKISGTLQVTGTISGTITIASGGGGSDKDTLADVVFGKETTVTIASPDAGHKEFKGLTGVTSITLSDATAIGNGAFLNLPILESFSAPEVLTVGINALRDCSSLESVFLPKAITIGDAAFGGCISLTSIDLPVCTAISSSMFSQCISLADIYLGCDTVVTLPDDFGEAFATDSGAVSIHVPSDLLASYQSAWASYISNVAEMGVTITLVGDYNA